MPERWENVVIQAALDVPVALESFDVGKIILGYIAHGPCSGLGLPPFLGLAFLRRKQVDTFRSRVADVTSAPAGVSETEGRVGAKNARSLPLPPRPITEQPIAQSLGVLAAGGIDPQAQTSHNGVGDNEPAADSGGLAGSNEAVGELGLHVRNFSFGGSPGTRQVLTRYSPGTQKCSARPRTRANMRVQYRRLS